MKIVLIYSCHRLAEQVADFVLITVVLLYLGGHCMVVYEDVLLLFY